MELSICGINCNECPSKDVCKGCTATDGRPFGGDCICALCIKEKGKDSLEKLKENLIKEFNALNISGMPKVDRLVALAGAYVNLEYSLSNGEKIKFLKDENIYLGYQLEKEGSDRCYGIIADRDFLLVCTYGCNGADPELLCFKKINLDIPDAETKESI